MRDVCTLVGSSQLWSVLVLRGTSEVEVATGDGVRSRDWSTSRRQGNLEGNPEASRTSLGPRLAITAPVEEKAWLELHPAFFEHSTSTTHQANNPPTRPLTANRPIYMIYLRDHGSHISSLQETLDTFRQRRWPSRPVLRKEKTTRDYHATHTATRGAPRGGLAQNFCVQRRPRPSAEAFGCIGSGACGVHRRRCWGG